MSNIELAKEHFSMPITFLEDKNLSLISDQMANDLELCDIENGKNVQQSLYNKVFKPTTKMGEIILPQWNEYYTNNTQYLKDTQSLIKNYKNVRFNVENPNQSKSIVDNFLTTWDEIKTNTEFRAKYLFFDWSFLDILNKYAFFLQLLSLYNLASPIFSLIVPILMLFVPFIILKMRGKNISLDNYLQILKQVLRNHALGQLFNNFSELSWHKRIYTMMSIFFYFFNVYQNILVCLRFKMNMKNIHKYFDDIKEYISYTINKIKNFSKYSQKLITYSHFNNAIDINKQNLENYLESLSKISPFSFKITKIMEIGTIMLNFFNFYTDETLNNSFLQSFGFHGYLDNIEGLQNNIRDERINFCKYTSKSCKFKQICHPTLADQEPIKNDINISKNMIITGPNAAGKTTLIKSTIINLLLSQQIGCGYYEEAKINPYDKIHCYINIPDTSGRDSLFQAEARRCKEILDDVYKNNNARHFCIFDELYSGTNPYEAVASAYGYLNYLILQNNCNYILTTHFINLCDLMKNNKKVLNKHMVVNIDEETQNLAYTYKFSNGISNVKGGTFVLKELEYPEEIISEAITTLEAL